VSADLIPEYITTLLMALLVGAGFVLQHAAATQPGSRFLSVQLIIELFRKPRWLAGIALLVARPGGRGARGHAGRVISHPAGLGRDRSQPAARRKVSVPAGVQTASMSTVSEVNR
jgi:hypothetical protein